MRVSPKKLKPVKSSATRKFYKGQEVWFRRHGRKIDANITKINTRAKTATVTYYWADDGKTYDEGATFAKLVPQRSYEIGDKVKVNTGNAWRNGEVEAFKNNLYVVFYHQDRRRWENSFRGSSLQPRS